MVFMRETSHRNNVPDTLREVARAVDENESDEMIDVLDEFEVLGYIDEHTFNRCREVIEEAPDTDFVRSRADEIEEEERRR